MELTPAPVLTNDHKCAMAGAGPENTPSDDEWSIENAWHYLTHVVGDADHKARTKLLRRAVAGGCQSNAMATK